MRSESIYNAQTNTANCRYHGVLFYSFLFAVLFYIVYYDWIGYHVKINAEILLYPYKLVLEVVLLFGLMSILLAKRVPHVVVVAFVLVLFFSASSMYSLSTGASGLGVAADVRNHIRPLLVFLVAALFFRCFNVSLNYLGWMLIAVVLFGSCYAIIEYSLYSGSYADSWRYKHLVEMYERSRPDFDLNKLVYQFERNDKLRSGGLSDSAIAAGLLFHLAFMISLYAILNAFDRRVWFLACVAVAAAILFAIAMYVTQVRSAILLTIIALASWWLFVRIPKILLIKPVFVMCTIASPLALFVYLSMNMPFFTDESAFGRLSQYYIVMASSTMMGNGFGSAPLVYDSMVLDLLNSIGVVGVFVYFIAMMYLFYNLIRELHRLGWRKLSGLFFGLWVSFMFVIFYQYTAGSSYHIILMAMLGVGYSIRRVYVFARSSSN
jgi:hypothetical protein